MLYDGFVGDYDKALMRDLRQADEEELSTRQFVFDDARLKEFVFRYRARNYEHSLNDQEQLEWHEFAAHRLQHGDENIQSISQFEARVSELLQNGEQNEKSTHLLKSLLAYSDSLKQRF